MSTWDYYRVTDLSFESDQCRRSGSTLPSFHQVATARRVEEEFVGLLSAIVRMWAVFAVQCDLNSFGTKLFTRHVQNRRGTIQLVCISKNCSARRTVCTGEQPNM